MTTVKFTAYRDPDLEHDVLVQSTATNDRGEVVVRDDLVDCMDLDPHDPHLDAATRALARAGWEVVGQWALNTATVIPGNREERP